MAKSKDVALLTQADITRFWSKIHRHRPDACWTWLGWKEPKGYGIFLHRVTHRIAYELLVGPIPKGLHLDHLCENRACCNPAHLEPVTPVINTLRGNGPAARNTRKTHCPRGHPYEGKNLRFNKKGGRVCRRCVSDSSNAYQKRKREQGPRPAPLPAARTHCPQGHPYAGDNLRVKANGWRVCRRCNRDRSAAHYRKLKAQANAAPSAL